jgi:hypothetical protein
VSKQFRLPAGQIHPLATGHGGCIASDLVTVHGQKVGYMYREEPSEPTLSGWVFLAGTESQEYMNDAANFEVYDVNTIANYDPEIISFLDAPCGVAFARNPETGQFDEEEFVPPEDSSQAAIAAGPPRSSSTAISETLTPDSAGDMLPTSGFCDECGRPVDPDETVFKLKTESVGVAAHRQVKMALCRNCADRYENTIGCMIWGMAAFVVVVVVLGSGAWLLTWLLL